MSNKFQDVTSRIFYSRGHSYERPYNQEGGEEFMKKLVIIPEDKWIPGLGRGPFLKPTVINEELYRSLVRNDYLVVEVTDVVEAEVPLNSEEEEVLATEPDTTEEVVEEVVEEELDNEESDEELPTESEEELFDEETLKFLKKKAKREEIVDLFTEKGLEFEEDATINELLALIGLKR